MSLFKSSSSSSSSSSSYSSLHFQKCAKPGCNNNAFLELRTGTQHDYCGRTHAEEALGKSAVDIPHGTCQTCNFPGCDDPVAFEKETGRVHDFCSRAHYIEAVNLKIWPPSYADTTIATETCSYPGCQKKCYFDHFQNRLHSFCGRSHAILAKTANIPSCTICLGEYSDTNPEKKVRCGHRFHQGCIDEWYAKSKNCPVCRKSI
jgi:hypothetical protein